MVHSVAYTSTATTWIGAVHAAAVATTTTTAITAAAAVVASTTVSTVTFPATAKPRSPQLCTAHDSIWNLLSILPGLVPCKTRGLAGISSLTSEKI